MFGRNPTNGINGIPINGMKANPTNGINGNPTNGMKVNSNDRKEKPTPTRDVLFVWLVQKAGEDGPGVAYTTEAEALIDARRRASHPPMAYFYEPPVENLYEGGHVVITRAVYPTYRYNGGAQAIVIQVIKVPVREKC